MNEAAVQEAEAQDLSSRVVALYARFQELIDTSNPQAVITDTAVRSWLGDVEAVSKLVTPESVARLGPHTSSMDNLRLAAYNGAERLLRVPWLSEETRGELRDFQERNPIYRQVGPYRFSSDWMSKCESEWRELLAPLVGKPDLRVLEIGSFEGRSVIWLLENVLTHPTSRITCVDLFDGPYAKVFDENIAASGAADRVETHAGLSGQVLRRLRVEPVYDFIYIDGSHQPLDVLEDAVLSWRLLRPGGLMTFDDYGMAAARLADFSRIARPDIGIDAFLSAAANQVEIVLKGFQVTVRKTAG